MHIQTPHVFVPRGEHAPPLEQHERPDRRMQRDQKKSIADVLDRHVKHFMETFRHFLVRAQLEPKLVHAH
eukprot:924762-Prymnesium_polylepis.1